MAHKSLLLLVPVLFITSLFTASKGDSSSERIEEAIAASSRSDVPYLKIELEELQSRIRLLESIADERSRDLKTKEDVISQKEKIIQQKSNTIISLKSEMASLKKGTVDAEEKVGKAHARAGELENQVDKLNNELQITHAEKVTLEGRIKEAEYTIATLNAKLEKLEKIGQEQKSKIRKTERALKIAEEEILTGKLEAKSQAQELLEVNKAWLPRWLAAHVLHCRSIFEVEWKEHGQPVMDVIVSKVGEKSVQARQWAEPHVENFQTNIVPALKDRWLLIVKYVEPHVQYIGSSLITSYETSKAYLIKVQEVSNPYYQDAKKASKPYIDHMASLARPHVDKVRIAIKPYSREAIRAYGRFLKSAGKYHNQVQNSVRRNLEKHEFTKYVATNELVWFVASAMLALPVIVLFQIASAFFLKKTVTKPVRNNHTRRKAKRSHADR